MDAEEISTGAAEQLVLAVEMDPNSYRNQGINLANGIGPKRQ